jgi:hypothetical protein
MNRIRIPSLSSSSHHAMEKGREGRAIYHSRAFHLPPVQFILFILSKAVSRHSRLSPVHTILVPIIPSAASSPKYRRIDGATS